MCTLNQHDVCLGCGRLINEITGWSSGTTAEKALILKCSKKRIQLLNEQLPELIITRERLQKEAKK
jgi:predicted Fe-S protein YdhL (DUF1289 family)|tara:strand:+ start:555 stop:752 length:198 start_codon:yes stop_codon:yes gene_type:complete